MRSGSLADLGDVWRSVNGRNWTRVATGAFPVRYEHGVAEHDGRLWVVGGKGASALADVWASTDGMRWERVTGAAAFSARNNHGVASHRGSLWVVGGDAGGSAVNDVWASADGGGLETDCGFGGVFGAVWASGGGASREFVGCGGECGGGRGMMFGLRRMGRIGRW